MKLDQTQIANEMRRSAQVMRDAGQDEIADGNDQIAEYIEGLECALAAERKLSRKRTAERDEARAQCAAGEGVTGFTPGKGDDGRRNSVEHNDPRNLDEGPLILGAAEYEVAEWHRQPDGKGEAEAIMFLLPLQLPHATLQVALRLGSPRATNELIEILEKYRDSVWPHWRQQN